MTATTTPISGSATDIGAGSTTLTDEQLRQAVQERYAAAARLSLNGPGTQTTCCGGAESCCGETSEPAETKGGSCCGDSPSDLAAGTEPKGGSCCGETPIDTSNEKGGCCGESAKTRPIDPISSGLYDEADTPFDSALAASLGCGNPTALAELAPGEDVLDLGSGGGLDVLLSARRVGPDGTAYGLDMTPEMLALAQRNQAEAGITNAEFMLGTIESVPMADASVDVVISNCVINLSHDKGAVLREAARVLRPGGRFAVSDIVLLRPIPEGLRGVMSLWTGCISGSLLDTDYLALLGAAGLTDASIEVTRSYDRDALEAMSEQLDPSHLPAGMTLAQAVDALDGAFASAFIRATKLAA